MTGNMTTTIRHFRLSNVMQDQTARAKRRLDWAHRKRKAPQQTARTIPPYTWVLPVFKTVRTDQTGINHIKHLPVQPKIKLRLQSTDPYFERSQEQTETGTDLPPQAEKGTKIRRFPVGRKWGERYRTRSCTFCQNSDLMLRHAVQIPCRIEKTQIVALVSGTGRKPDRACFGLCNRLSNPDEG